MLEKTLKYNTKKCTQKDEQYYVIIKWKKKQNLCFHSNLIFVKTIRRNNVLIRNPVMK